jgi:hypothetical protein
MQSATLQTRDVSPTRLPESSDGEPGSPLQSPAPTPPVAKVPLHPLGIPRAVGVEAYGIALGQILDFAEGWDCARGPHCENRAYASELFPTEDEARHAVRAYVLERCAGLFPSWSPEHAYRELDRLDGLEHVHILRVTGVVDACFDYREVGCQIQNAFDQLRQGEGQGAAWRIMRRQREQYGARAVRLPGRTSEGLFFGFLTACDRLRMVPVAEVRPPEL